MLYVASSKSQMTDYDKYYIYTGHENGMNTGYWYFWNGIDWTIGGEYKYGVDDIIEMAEGLDSDDLPANSKVVGDALDEIRNHGGKNNFYNFTDELTQTVINNGGITHEFPVGNYLLITGLGSDGVYTNAGVYLIGASKNESVTTNKLQIIGGASPATLALTKETLNSETFRITVNHTSPNTFLLYLICLE